MLGYRKRIVDDELGGALQIAGAVLIEGARGCGKTETGRAHSSSEALLDTDPNARELARISPELLLSGATPRLIDEWQLEPSLWDHIRREVDRRREKGQFILTGSSTPADEGLRHSGAARVLRLRMRPMSLGETGASTGVVSLRSLLEGELHPGHDERAPSVQEVADILAQGGWPGMQGLAPAASQTLLRSYLDDIARIDIPRLEGEPRRDVTLVQRTLAALARHVGTEVTQAAIATDAGGSEGPLRSETVATYLDLLERLFVIEYQPSWAPHLRSRDKVRRRPKLHFVDPALAVAGLGASPASLLRDLRTFGLLFESLVVRDLRVYAQRADASVSHYRDSSNVEVDAIVQARDGRWVAVEVKLGPAQADAAAASLLAFRAKIDEAKTPPPSALVVITTGSYAFRRPDGVLVVPVTMLGP